jgi:NitT/TauT family transport system substrate-binding protein
MKKNRSMTAAFALLLLVSLILGACAQPSAPTSPPEGTTAPAEGESPAGETVTLKLALLRILDALPIYVAQQNGYFAEQGVNVEIIPVSAAAERDQVMAAAQADGMINDLISTLFYNQDSTQIQIVRFARSATSEYPQYRILASKNSGITDVQGLKGVEIGISEASVIAYTTDRLLQAEGLAPSDIKTVAVPKIPERMELLNSGQLQAANMPDPFALLAIQNGAVLIVDDTKHPEYGNSVLSFRKAVIDEHPQAIRGFLAALEKAVIEVNADPSRWDSLLSEEGFVPASLIGSYKIPTFPEASIPTQEQFSDVLDWAMEKDLVAKEISYQDSVTSAFLPVE